MKKAKWLSLLLAVVGCALFTLSACGASGGTVQTPTEQTTPNQSDDAAQPSEPNQQNPSGEEEGEMVEEIYLTVNSRQIAVKLERNSATEALVELLKEGDITYTASNYGGFEKVGALGRSLPRSDVRMTASAGDVMLYLGNQVVLFYGSNTWEYTKLGKMDLSAEELKELLSSPDPAEVTISLH